jgi:rRNA biogenesis protein RRP5
MKVFQRALQYNDPKKVYLALLGMYETTKQHKLGGELLDKMVKKFKHSYKVLLVFPTIIFFPSSKYLYMPIF